MTIDVESSETPLSLSIQPSMLEMRVGEETGLTVAGTCANGSRIDLTKSRQTTFVSAAPNIVTVTREGLVKAVGAGFTQIRVSDRYFVPVTVEPPDTGIRTKP